ncbi:hypothetical protein HDU80_008467 [Chytriomyces hyalinus]|nr:hypothetical protein HDU80_008467 [Chytriomyces hyalinus]
MSLDLTANSDMALDTLTNGFSIVFLVIGNVAILFNYTIVLLNLKHAQQLAPSSFIILWLCFFDGTSILSNVIVTVQHLLRNNVSDDALSIQVHGALIVFAQCSSLLLCFGLTFFRYLVIVQNMQLSRYFATIYTSSVAVLSCLIAGIPFFLGTQNESYILRPSTVYCSPDWSLRNSDDVLLTWACFAAVFLPTSFVVYAYVAIMSTVRQSVLEVKSSQMIIGDTAGAAGTDMETSEAGITVGEKIRPRPKMELQQDNLLKQSIIIVCAFLIGWTPYVICGFFSGGIRASPFFDYAAAMCVTVYDVINPIIVYKYDRDIRANCIKQLNAVEIGSPLLKQHQKAVESIGELCPWVNKPCNLALFCLGNVSVLQITVHYEQVKILQISICLSTVSNTGLTAIVFNYAIVVLNLPYLHTLTPSSYLIFWLCFFDGTSILSDAFITISRLLHGADAEFGMKLCALQAAVIVFGQCSSLLMCFGLTLFRYIIIVRETELPKYFTTMYTFGVIASMCLVAALPFMLGTQNQSYILRPSGIYCAPDWRVRDSKGLILSYSCLVIIVLPVGFMAYAYASMIGAVNRAVSDVKRSVTGGTAGTIRSNLELEMPPDAKSNHLSLKFNSRRRPKTEMEIQQEALLRQSIIVGAFFIGWTPYIISKLALRYLST